MKKKSSKRYKKLIEVSKGEKNEPISDAITKVKKNCTTMFDESMDVSFSLNFKSKQEETNLRTIVNLPNGNGKKLMDFAESFAVENNFISIRLDTFSLNQRNNKFYRSRGYTQLGDVFFPMQSDLPFHCYEKVLL